MAVILSLRVGLRAGFCCSSFSTNEGLKGGAEGFITPDCCNELLIWIEGFCVELFSILTDSSLFELFLINVATQVSSIIEASEAPIPISGHFKFSNRGVGSCWIMGIS